MTANEIYTLIDNISSEKNTDINNIEKVFLSNIIEQLNNAITIKAGSINGIDKGAGEVITKAINNFTKTKVYQKSLQSILRNINGASNEKLSFYKDKGLKLDRKELSKNQKLAINEMLDSLSKDGLNAKFNQTLRVLIYDNIRIGSSQNDLTKKLEKLIVTKKAPTEINKYFKQSVQLAADSYSKVVDNAIYEKFKTRITGFKVIGSLIETSSPQCKAAVEDYNRFIPIDKLDEVLSIAKDNGLIEGTNAENLSINGLHWGCRHQFIPSID